MKRLLIVLGMLAVAATAVAGLSVRWADARLDRPYLAADAAVDVEIVTGMTARRLSTVLATAGVIAAARDLVWWLWWTERAADVQAGEYRFDGPVSVREVADVITEGRVRLYPVTLPEGSTRWQAAVAIASAGFGIEEDALLATARIDWISDLDPEAADLEGYLFPETYMVPRSASPEAIVKLMVDAFRAAWTPARTERATELGWTIRQAITLASLIEAETPSAPERTIVSAVFHNRLERGMLLQTDPTVLYARRVAGKDGRTIYMSDLQRDSPYNTYLYAGLPVGPIGSPREASIEAALYPAESGYLYFVSRNDGTHAFSSTLREHIDFVNQYQR